jgi:hypothetical protein
VRGYDPAQQPESLGDGEAHVARADRLRARLGTSSGKVVPATLSRGDGSEVIGAMPEAAESQSRTDTLLRRDSFRLNTPLDQNHLPADESGGSRNRQARGTGPYHTKIHL